MDKLGKFKGIAERIARVASDKGITVSQLHDIIRSEDIMHIIFREDIIRISDRRYKELPINCYPGLPGDKCHRFALFVSLSGSLHSGQWWYTFSRTLEALVLHFQGKCRRESIVGVVITDTWDNETYEKWKHNIEAIKQNGVYLEAYLIGKGWAIEIPL